MEMQKNKKIKNKFLLQKCVTVLFLLKIKEFQLSGSRISFEQNTMFGEYIMWDEPVCVL